VTTTADVSSQIIQLLQVTIPDLDTSVGSVSRKIIDAVSSQIADASIDTQLLTYSYDIYSMTGANLDSFVQLFGMTRIPAARATGTVTFTRTSSTDTVTIPVGTQVATSDSSVIVQTLTTAILPPGSASAAVPVQAVTAGPDGNVSAGSLTVILTPVAEITAATNLGALTGGTNQETDSQLQARWVATVFRNMAGTSAMFEGIALNNPAVTAANVVGASSQWTEQLQVVSGAATSTITDAQYVYPAGETAGNDIEGGDVAVPGLQYTWNYASIPPSITVIDSSYFPSGDIFTLQYQYIDAWSRNSAANGIFNRVDVWCAGQVATAASQTVAWLGPAAFSATSTNAYYNEDFVRPDGSSPAVGNYFIPLSFVPVLTMDPVLTIGAQQYGLATAAHPLGTSSGDVDYAYQIVHRNDASGWGPYSEAGLEWEASMALASGTAIPAGSSGDYTYNAVPLQVQQAIDNWRLASIDVIAHQAIETYLRFSLAVIFDPSVTSSVTVTAVQQALSSWLSQLGFGATVYPSSVIQQVENVAGVTAARFLTGSDWSGWNSSDPDSFDVGIQQTASDGTTVLSSYVDTNGAPVDIILGAAQIPAFGSLYYIAKAGNSFGSFA
jgi:uncharacterized phage protein gp47/JayE